MEAAKTEKPEPITTRTEILFVYDIADANPNGDPNDENRPRMDLEAGRAKVSDVRLKRTIRDYLHDYCGEEIFCRQIEKADGTIQEGKDRAEDFFEQLSKDAKKDVKNVLEKRDFIEAGVIAQCIDIRLFGATIPVSGLKKEGKDSSVTLTGAVQFAMGTTLHRVEPRFIKGTGAFASGQGAQQKTFREEYNLPYGLIAIYGIVNQKAAETTKLTSEDAERLYEAIWYGTKSLITRSKIGQRPLLLVLVEYDDGHSKHYVGRLDQFLDLKRGKDGGVTIGEPSANGDCEIRDEALRDVTQVTLDITELGKVLSGRKERIARIRFAWNKLLKLSQEPQEQDAKWTFLGCNAEKLEFD
ncbi:MAG: type I-B CRISPR-associated protein Cas7/Csh2 [Acidobacteriia bacterium]|nr:type I-B CRISPR-associated protein Cas7/Csh2 [Terriglobia bacterium]